jgi:phosphoesterase RecJ-like protein
MEGNLDYQKALEVINKSKNILITSHVKPDGDSCGCIVSITEAFKSNSKKITPLLLSSSPEWYKFLFDTPPAVLGENIATEQLRQAVFDLIIIVDTSSYTQLPDFEDYLKAVDIPVLVIDHHLASDGVGDVELIDSSAAAAALVVYDFLKFAKLEITPKIAEALFVAIATDTGWFQFNNTDSRVHRVCAELIETWIHPAEIYHRLYQNFSPQRIKLMTKMFDNLELHFHGRYAVQHLLQSDFRETGADLNDTENLIDECRRIRTVEVAALFVEMPDGKIKCSLRSRGAVNVGQIAQKLGGGGHKMASGITMNIPLNAAQQAVKSEVQKQLNIS